MYNTEFNTCDYVLFDCSQFLTILSYKIIAKEGLVIHYLEKKSMIKLISLEKEFTFTFMNDFKQSREIKFFKKQNKLLIRFGDNRTYLVNLKT